VILLFQVFQNTADIACGGFQILVKLYSGLR